MIFLFRYFGKISNLCLCNPSSTMKVFFDRRRTFQTSNTRGTMLNEGISLNPDYWPSFCSYSNKISDLLAHKNCKSTSAKQPSQSPILIGLIFQSIDFTWRKLKCSLKIRFINLFYNLTIFLKMESRKKSTWLFFLNAAVAMRAENKLNS